jgi:hypothetical protein
MRSTWRHPINWLPDGVLEIPAPGQKHRACPISLIRLTGFGNRATLLLVLAPQPTLTENTSWIAKWTKMNQVAK